MGKAFLNAYSLLLIKTCHRRGAFAMGGMAAQIPVKGDAHANDEAFAKVRADKEREARAGHDGTWVAHPDLVPIAQRGVRPSDARGQSASGCARRRAGDGGRHDRGSPRQAHRGGPAPQPARRRPIYRGLAARPRRRADLSPDGGRGDGRDFPRPGLAMAASEGEARRRPRGDARHVPGRARGRDGAGARRGRRLRLRRRPLQGGDRALLGHVAEPTISRNS